MRLLNEHFRFVGPIAFASSESDKDAARREIADFLRARGFES
jgi:hypothetical protein